ncbi:class D sortase [Evansella sp. AB-P1]|uniref:class D sortase n=1 Tax=Evansella sp. AB-P1 TaxID=3037653 RepID=UPI00241F8152|nr:class D sortase [Evansella sp. AB-P1]MDG5788977.1 class D sortase [Evansella sp. AB-P1]
MGKWIGITLILASIYFLGVGGYQFYEMNAEKNSAMKEAQNIVYAESRERGNLEDGLSSIIEPERGDIIGIFAMPTLDEEYPIVEGTDEEELKSGVGHFIGTGFPGEEKQILLSGHRDTVFRNLGELQVGDIIEVKMSYGTFQYVIEETFIVDKDDRTVIDYEIDDEVLTVSTCYPFRYIGDAPERYIINAKPIEV